MTIHQILTLARVSNLPTVCSNVLMAYVVAGGSLERWPALIFAMLGAMLMYAGGCTHNDACDVGWDTIHKPDRLIPSGSLTKAKVQSLAMTEMKLGTIALMLAASGGWREGRGLLGFWWPLLLAAAILLYNFRHKENPFSVVVMGACRALLVLSAATVAWNWESPPVLIAAAVLWFYIILLSLLARRESRPGGSFLRTVRPAWSVGRWVGEMLAAIPLVDAVLIWLLRPQSWSAAVVCLLLWPLCRLLQRKFAAT